MTAAAVAFGAGGEVRYTAGPRLGATLTVAEGDGAAEVTAAVVGAAVLLTGLVSAGDQRAKAKTPPAVTAAAANTSGRRSRLLSMADTLAERRPSRF
ncbi:hypothetical protein Aab01nite_62540 [Paractinoplanes abujensis]|nr:hypothetical protein Aab01nite_62540 [Actinoplanes abujensis]